MAAVVLQGPPCSLLNTRYPRVSRPDTSIKSIYIDLVWSANASWFGKTSYPVAPSTTLRVTLPLLVSTVMKLGIATDRSERARVSHAVNVGACRRTFTGLPVNDTWLTPVDSVDTSSYKGLFKE